MTAELSKDIAKLITAVSLLNYPQVDEAVCRITGEGGREGGREREKELLNEMLFLLLIEANILFISIIFIIIMDGYHFMPCVHRLGSFTVDTTQAHIHMHKAHQVTMVNVLLHTGTHAGL